jgi:hypothetical protein
MNQSSQPTSAMLFLQHTLWSFGVGILLAGLTAIGQYLATSGSSINLTIILTVGASAFVAFAAAFFKQAITPNVPELLQGVKDWLAELHNPLINQMTGLASQVATLSQQVAVLQTSAQPPALPQVLPPPNNLNITQPMTAIQTTQAVQTQQIKQ